MDRRDDGPDREEVVMRVVVDFDACEAHGDCVGVAPEIFDLSDDDEVVTLLQEEPDEALRARAQEAVDVCPIVAIHIED